MNSGATPRDEKKTVAFKQNKNIKKVHLIEKDFFDENLFVLADDLEKAEIRLQYEYNDFGSIEEKYSEFSVFSSKSEASIEVLKSSEIQRSS